MRALSPRRPNLAEVGQQSDLIDAEFPVGSIYATYNFAVDDIYGVAVRTLF